MRTKKFREVALVYRSYEPQRRLLVKCLAPESEGGSI
jgi:hypothetical protein